MRMLFNITFIDLVIFFKSKAMEESNNSHTDDKGNIKKHSHGDYGLLAIDDEGDIQGVNTTWYSRFGQRPFQKGDVKNPDEPLWNIGAAMTFWLGKLAWYLTGDSEAIRKSDMDFSKMTLNDWYCAESLYGPGDEKVGWPNPNNLTDHAKSIRNRFLHYRKHVFE